MQQALDVAFKAAASEATVLLRGESGTGKGVLARAIHARSPRAGRAVRHRPLSEPVGGAAGKRAVRPRPAGRSPARCSDTVGKVAAAEGGTLFLDEIGDLPPPLQPKLLRLLQEKRYERVGETRTRAGDVRILAATNRDLEAEVAAGPLPRGPVVSAQRHRGDAAAAARSGRATSLPLAEHLLRFFARQTGKPLTRLHRRGAGGPARATPGRATSASCATPSSAASSWPPGRRSAWPTCRRRSARRRRPGVEVGGRVTLDAAGGRAHPPRPRRDADHRRSRNVLGIDPSTLYRKRKRYGL